nr:reverse transcriptase domain-containing protein [Tanacetum cinerariifolium]
MADNRTMAELLQAPTEGYEDAIVIPEIAANNFELKHGLINLVQNKQFFGHDKEDLHAHIHYFNKITSTMRVPNTSYLKNEISQFTQRFEETFGEAWEHFKEMLRACPDHGFSELTQIDTLYNGLNEQDQDSLNAAAGGNLLSKTTREALKIIENKSKVRYSRSKSNVSRVNTNSRDSSSKTDDRIDKLADQISNLVEIVNKQVITPATAKVIEKTCVICGGAHAYYDCIAIDSNQHSVCAETGIENSFYDTEGDILYLEKLLNDDPFQLPLMDLKQAEETKAKSLIEEPPKLELKELLSHLEYVFLEETDKLPVIIAKDLKDVEKEALLKVLKFHKCAIAWKISDIKGIDPRFCTHKILMEEDYKPAVQSQKRVNLKIHDVIKKEVIKLLDAEMIYPISDSPWVSPIHCVPKKGGMTVVANENNELIPTSREILRSFFITNGDIKFLQEENPPEQPWLSILLA